ncbi:MAG: DUF5916 domain-containing protein [Flavobacterium sp.]|uniref:DUF5916 domain-containing protein n=1 Tax=Flavobacterium sp. TaxID=239 RepID=UPI002733B5A5|nr:DUF5916 domain-containing protein [Flavobacterium sp.]MDP3681084.1 DUF5916 domain-containing protein [Flavobacterium sp.]MDZ4331230.1 DUF5916 domain-containing protein [Flavobacterium sp.]
MSKLHSIAIFYLIFFSYTAYSQKKTLQAKSITENITIDGKINEEIWETASVATNFVMFEPDNGKPISNDKRTEVKVLYDNNAIYISALLYDNEPEKIQREITKRDVFGVSDHFSVYINGFNDGQQDFRFFISAAGVQMDCLAIEDSEDFTWDAIWDSEVTVTEFGWVVEMKIPYAALRFSKADKQTWGLNFMREIKRDVQKYTWNRIDTKIGAVIPQAGILQGIESIQTPTRLFLIPYSSAYYQQSDIGSDTTLKAGLDIKYGINDSFTLDAILVPDFGQTKFDNAILNLEPFEQQLEENRPFFTEGTDLFNKGGLFYSRRIGGAPSTEPATAANEEITNYPSTVDLLNAVKISGRTEKGLGIGFLNAVTERTKATILNNDTGEVRKEVIEPLTNYNMLVLDQRFNQNSSVSFVNANTTRNGGFRDANASALLFDLNTKENTYNLYGDFKYSSINAIEDYDGYKTSLNFQKTSGRYRYLFSGKYISENYDINDLGIIFYTNYHGALANGSYRIVNPTKIFNTLKIEQELNLEIHNTTGKMQEGWYKTVVKATSLNNDYFELAIVANPLETFDFYEPREYGRYVFIPKKVYAAINFSSNDNNPFTLIIQPSLTKFNENDRNIYGFYISPKYRFNDRFSIAYVLDYFNETNDRGWVDSDNTGVIFAERNRETAQNDFTGKYALNNRMTINLTARYYWSYSKNHEFFTLQNNGYLTPNNTYAQNKDRNFNSWNFDLSYSWWFAPGSEISILYRNYGLERASIVEKDLSKNLKSIFNSDLTNVLSISIRYFIDYNAVKNKF